MPEGDTVWRTARRLHEALAGREVVAAELRWPGLSTAELQGRTTVEVVSRGKHLLHRIEGGLTLHSHLRMEGRWRIERTTGLAAGWRGSTELRALVATADWTALGLRLGQLDLVPTSSESELVGHLGPDLLDGQWGHVMAAHAVGNLHATPSSIAEALLDQRNLAGLGTIWTAETLFGERVAPWQSAADLSPETLLRLVRRAHTLLDRARRSASPGRADRDAARPAVHGRVGRPCPRCGATIRSVRLGPPAMARTIGYCPGCQGTPGESRPD